MRLDLIRSSHKVAPLRQHSLARTSNGRRDSLLTDISSTFLVHFLILALHLCALLYIPGFRHLIGSSPSPLTPSFQLTHFPTASCQSFMQSSKTLLFRKTNQAEILRKNWTFELHSSYKTFHSHRRVFLRGNFFPLPCSFYSHHLMFSYAVCRLFQRLLKSKMFSFLMYVCCLFFSCFTHYHIHERTHLCF